MIDMLNAATGFEFTPESYLTVGENIWNQTRNFNVREGFSAKDDVLPSRFYNEKSPEGDPKGIKIDMAEFEKARAEYYSLRGWNVNGVPHQKKILN
jgi:aldehyde:ferredoxin oxidoreductase